MIAFLLKAGPQFIEQQGHEGVFGRAAPGQPVSADGDGQVCLAAVNPTAQSQKDQLAVNQIQSSLEGLGEFGITAGFKSGKGPVLSGWRQITPFQVGGLPFLLIEPGFAPAADNFVIKRLSIQAARGNPAAVAANGAGVIKFNCSRLQVRLCHRQSAPDDAAQ